MGTETTERDSMMETPTIYSNTTASNVYSATDAGALMNLKRFVSTAGSAEGSTADWHSLQSPDFNPRKEIAAMAAPAKDKDENQMRVVKVYIADDDDNLKLEQRLLYTGDEKLTDFTDQELFFEVPINDILKKHNDVRAKTVDKKASDKFGREIFLEPVRIRDLKMVVVEVAVFE